MSLSTQVADSKKPYRCLIVQLARMGDTLQSLMALRAAKQLYPQLEVHLLVRDRFSTAARRVPWIEGLFTLPIDELLGPIIRGEKTQGDTMVELIRWVAPIIQDPWDMVINWSYSDASSFLVGLIPARVKLGYTRRRDSSFYGTDGWSHYIQGVVQSQIHQNVHLTDILTTQLLTALQIHEGDPITDGNSPVTSKSFFSLLLQDRELKRLFASNGTGPGRTHPLSGASSKKWISLQLGRSSTGKGWTQKDWGQLARSLLENHPDYSLFLLGNSEDAVNLEELYAELTPEQLASGRLYSLVGLTGFDLWASMISRSQWLIAGDTAALHLASVLGTRVLCLSFEGMRFYESGPYGNGHYVISSNAEGSCATPALAYAVWSYASNEWIHRKQQSLEEHVQKLCPDSDSAELLSSILVYRSRIRNTNDGGGVVYEPLMKRPIHLNDWTASVMGHIARFWYCGWVPPIGTELDRQTIGTPLIQKLRELQECSDVMLKICEEASRSATSLQFRGASLKSEKVMSLQDREDIRKLGEKLQDLDLLMIQLGKNHFPLTAFSNMSTVLLNNLKGSHLSELGRETASSYRLIGEGLKLFKDWIQFTLNLAKPKAINVNQEQTL